MRRLIVCLLCALVMGANLVGTAPAAARASRGIAPAPAATDDNDESREDASEPDEPRAKNAGSIDGVVTAIDYQASTMAVAAGARKVGVTILPSTNIQGPGNGFRSISDIKKGAHVRVLMSERGKTLTAQIITLR